MARLAVLAAVGMAAALFAAHFAVDWVYDDDTLLVRWLGDLAAGRLGTTGLLALWNNQHPVGSQVAATGLVVAAFGLHLEAVVGLSLAIILATAGAAASLCRDAILRPSGQAAFALAMALLAFHPIQMEHLLWAFELGWFMVNACVVLNALLVERLGLRAAPAVVLLCLVATFSSAQGAFAWFAAALHVALRPKGRRRWVAAAGLAAGGAWAVLRILDHDAARAAPDAAIPDAAALAVYAAQIVGTLVGTRRHGLLLAVGLAALTLAAALVLRVARRRPDPVAFRAGIALCLFSGLSVLGFAKGRIGLGLDWALASFHAAPLLVPLMLGSTLLVASAAPVLRRGDRVAAVLAGSLALLLVVGLALSWPYGWKRARLWTMDRGYAVFAACERRVPFAVAVRAAGAEPYAELFQSAQGRLATMCPARLTGLAAALTREPPLFQRLGVDDPAARPALAQIWQDYATDLILQVAFDPQRPDTPARLIGLAKREVARGPPFDHRAWAPFADAIRALP